MSLFGLVITLSILIIFIPLYGYMAAAWASFSANLSMMVLSYFLGQKYYPIPYNLKTALNFTLLAAGLASLMYLNFQYSHSRLKDEWYKDQIQKQNGLAGTLGVSVFL